MAAAPAEALLVGAGTYDEPSRLSRVSAEAGRSPGRPGPPGPPGRWAPLGGRGCRGRGSRRSRPADTSGGGLVMWSQDEHGVDVVPGGGGTLRGTQVAV